MRAVVQRVLKSEVVVEEKVISSINTGVLVLLGIENQDDEKDVFWLANKIGSMRIFPDERNKMEKSIIDIKGEILVVSQFTLHASTKKGNRPSYIRAAKFDQALLLYKHFLDCLSSLVNKKVKSGTFGANMKVSLINDGPVTIVIDSKNKE
mgnify:CR=1 FL=1